MTESLPFLLSGIIFGLTAGISPGPLLTLVISETLKYGKIEGIKIAIAPILTDIPIVLAIIFLLSRLSNINYLLGIISLFGAFFIGYLAYESIIFQGVRVNVEKVKPMSFKKGIITNVLSPHPYIFWFTVGGTIVFDAYKVNLFAPIIFIASFYVCLIGSKVLVALITEKSRAFLTSQAYSWITRLLG